MKDMKAVVVFTGKDLNIMRTEGGVRLLACQNRQA